MAHNHEVAGSSPVPATKTSALRKEGFCFGSCAKIRTCDADLLQQICKSQVRRSEIRKESTKYFLFGRAEKDFSPLSCPRNQRKRPIFVMSLFLCWTVLEAATSEVGGDNRLW